MLEGKVIAVSLSDTHSFSKTNYSTIHLIEGLGVQGDAHCGKFVKHRSRVKKDPSQINLRQVHLIHHELITELNSEGFNIAPGQMGENITTTGISLLDLPRNTLLFIGEHTVLKLTGLRNPCSQLNKFRPGLMHRLIYKDELGGMVRMAGVMSIVINSGPVSIGDLVRVELPKGRSEPLEVV